MAEALGNLEFTPEEIHSRDDKVLAIASAHGIGRSSGAPVDWHGAHLFTVRRGRIIGMEVFDDPDAAFEAAGMAK
jgi:ketosteroid isomerase-like protein